MEHLAKKISARADEKIEELSKKIVHRTTTQAASGVHYTINKKKYILDQDLALQFLDKPYILDESSLDQAYELMKYVHDLFSLHKIVYWAIGGTLLGAIRHGSQIPWDDDIDIAVIGHNTTIDQIRILEVELSIKGYILIETMPGFVIQKLINPKVHMDIFFLDKDIQRFGHPDYMLSAPYDRHNNPSFAVSSIYPHDRYPIHNRILWNFNDYQIWIPENYKEQLDITYRTKENGNNWDKCVRYSEDQKAHALRFLRPALPVFERMTERTIGYDRVARMYKKVNKL